MSTLRREDFPRLRFGLVQRLRSVRRRMRFALVVEATARLVAAALIVFAIAAFLDWLVRFPVILRTIFLFVGAAWAGVFAYRRMLRPVIAPVPLDELALAIDGVPGPTRDLWASTIRFLNDGAEGSREMWSRVLAETDRAAAQAVPSRLVRLRPAGKAVLAAAVCSGVVCLIWLWAPWAVRTGADRLARPMSGAQWPKKRVIEPLSGDTVVAWGETYTVEMRLERGDDPGVRGYVAWRAGGDPLETALMRRDPDGVYRLTLENVRQPIRYSFRAGDDDTSNEPFLLRVVKRPEVEAARLTFRPPLYAGHLPITTDTLEDHDAEALAGSTARLEVRPSKLIAGDTPSRAEIVFDDGEPIPLVREDAASIVLSAEFPVTRSGTLQVRLVDSLGLESRASPIYRLRVRTDEPPVVNITSPESVIEATLSAVIEVRVLAQDDVGLAAVRLMAGRGGTEMGLLSDLLTHDTYGNKPPPLRAEFVYEWELAGLSVVVGDVVEYVAEAKDVFPSDGENRRTSRSAVGRIHVISAERLAERLRMELLSVREQLRSLIAAVQDSRDRTTALDAGPSRSIPLTDLQRGEAERLAGGLQRLREISESQVRSLQEVRRQAERNQLRESTAAQQAERLAKRLYDAAPPALHEAAATLQRSAQSDRADAQHEDLRASEQTQSELLQALRSMVREMDQWSEYEEFVRRLREALDRQEWVERETTQLARRTGGLMTETLDPSPMSQDASEGIDEQQETARVAAAQMQLRSEAAQLFAAMLEWAGEKAEEDRASAESLRDAVTVGYRLAVLERMDEAVGAVQTGRMPGAAQSQRDAAAGLRAMIAALGDRPDRQLAELSRDLTDVTGRLRRLIRSQESLIERNRGARDTEDSEMQFEELADRQASLRTTARRVADMIKQDDDDARHAKERVLAAADEMAAASEWLDGGASIEAETHQVAAVDSLREALAALEDYQDRVDQEMGERSLEALVEAMLEVRRRQQALRAETADIRSQLDTDSVPTHADGLRLTHLSRLQRELIEPTQHIREKAGESVVYVYLLDRVLASMDKAAGRLAAQDGAAALMEQDRVIRDLGRLIEAAQEPRDEKQPRFVQDSDGGGGGAAGQPTASKPVPTLAELKVLKALQSDVSEETAGLSAQIPETPLRTERELREIESLGQRQRELRELANRMVERAADGR